MAAVVLCATVGLAAPPLATAQTPTGSTADPSYAMPTADTPQGVLVDSVSLVENARSWDGREVSFRGEAIGERMVRGLHAWIHLNDDVYMWKNIEEGAELGGYNSGQAIWASAESAARIVYFGDYAHEGDVVEATGRFNAACPEHGGDMDIHATRLAIVQVGHPVGHIANAPRAAVAFALVGVAGVLWRVRARRRKRRM